MRCAARLALLAWLLCLALEVVEAAKPRTVSGSKKSQKTSSASDDVWMDELRLKSRETIETLKREETRLSRVDGGALEMSLKKSESLEKADSYWSLDFANIKPLSSSTRPNNPLASAAEKVVTCLPSHGSTPPRPKLATRGGSLSAAWKTSILETKWSVSSVESLAHVMLDLEPVNNAKIFQALGETSNGKTCHDLAEVNVVGSYALVPATSAAHCPALATKLSGNTQPLYLIGDLLHQPFSLEECSKLLVGLSPKRFIVTILEHLLISKPEALTIRVALLGGTRPVWTAYRPMDFSLDNGVEVVLDRAAHALVAIISATESIQYTKIPRRFRLLTCSLALYRREGLTSLGGCDARPVPAEEFIPLAQLALEFHHTEDPLVLGEGWRLLGRGRSCESPTIDWDGRGCRSALDAIRGHEPGVPATTATATIPAANVEESGSAAVEKKPDIPDLRAEESPAAVIEPASEDPRRSDPLDELAEPGTEPPPPPTPPPPADGLRVPSCEVVEEENAAVQVPSNIQWRW